MRDLLDDTINPAMPRLARDYAKRAGMTLRGIAQDRGIGGAVPVAVFCTDRGITIGRTFDDLVRLLAEKPATKRAARVVSDTRTLDMF